MKIVYDIARWLKLEKWLRKNRNNFILVGVGLLILLAWFITGTFFQGVAVLLLMAVLLGALKVARWVTLRIKVTVDAGIPLSPLRMTKEVLAERAKFSDADDRWALFTRAQNIKHDGQSPTLRRKQMTANGDVKAHINMAAIGGNLDSIRKHAADGTLAGIMDCKEVSVRETKLNRAWLTFYNNHPLQRAHGLVDLPVPHAGFVSFGIDEDGEAAEVEHGLSVISIGETGSGKSKAMWNMFASMLRSRIPTEIDLFDPKGTELSVFKPLVGKKVGNILIRSYSRTIQQAEVVMTRFIAEMKERQDLLDDRQLTTATAEMPARYVWADEMNELASLYAKPDSSMVTLVSQGRSSKDALMASVQVAKVANLGHIRDQIPINICMRTKTKENTKAALALDGDVPPCHMIPRNTPGVGYYIKANGEQRKFRTAHVTDKQLDDLAEGKLPTGMVTVAQPKYTGPPCFVYVGPDKSGCCGYVGIAGGEAWEKHPVSRRRAQHRKNDRVWCHEHERVENWWKVHILDNQLEVFKYPSRAAALIAEERLIKELKPRWNIVHNLDNPLANVNMSKRAGYSRRAKDAAREYVELGRDVRAVRRVQAEYRKQERVAGQAVKRERFVETVTTGELVNSGDLR